MLKRFVERCAAARGKKSKQKRSFGGFGATSTRVRKRKRGLRLESLEARTC